MKSDHIAIHHRLSFAFSSEDHTVYRGHESPWRPLQSQTRWRLFGRSNTTQPVRILQLSFRPVQNCGTFSVLQFMMLRQQHSVILSTSPCQPSTCSMYPTSKDIRTTCCYVRLNNQPVITIVRAVRLRGSGEAAVKSNKDGSCAAKTKSWSHRSRLHRSHAVLQC